MSAVSRLYFGNEICDHFPGPDSVRAVPITRCEKRWCLPYPFGAAACGAQSRFGSPLAWGGLPRNGAPQAKKKAKPKSVTERWGRRLTVVGQGAKAPAHAPSTPVTSLSPSSIGRRASEHDLSIIRTPRPQLQPQPATAHPGWCTCTGAVRSHAIVYKQRN